MVPPPEGNRAQETKDPPPYGILAAAAVIVAFSAALPIALLVTSRDAPAATAEPDGGARTQPRASAQASAAIAPTATIATTPTTTPPPIPSEPEDAGAGAGAGAPGATADKLDAAVEASAEAQGPGWLSITTAPLPARVTERGRVLCTATPCAKLSLSPGEHVLLLENKEESLKKKLVVTITSGETIARRVPMKAAASAP